MSLRHLAPVLALVVLSGAVPDAEPQQPAPARQARDSEKLPVRRVVLYKSGIGYFEHLGKVRDSQTVTVDFTSAQLNDVLKSLTTLDLGGGRIASVSYNSEAPIEQRLGLIRLPLGEDPTRAQFLGALRGVRVEVQAGGPPITGRILSVERVTRRKGDASAEVDELSIVTDGSELRTIELGTATSVRVRDSELAEQVSSYLTLLASRRDRDLRRMHVATTGQGERDVFVSYVSEVPVWKTTYRIVLPSKPSDKPLLQGWAIVDNTVGEDWTNVELALVAGAPHSFVLPISQPQYARRPIVAMPQQLLPTPQTHAPTLEQKADGEASRAPVPIRVGGNVGGGVSGGVAGGVMSGTAAPPPPTASAPRAPRAVAEEVRMMAESVSPAAEGQELGDLFEYRLKEPITIRKNESALVPILSAPVEIDKVTLVAPGSGTRPLRALWLTNTSGQTIDNGSFTVIEADAFAGEGLIATLKPGERRLLSYATDLAVVVSDKRESEIRRVTRIRSVRGVLVVTRDERDRRAYKVRNEDREPRTVVIEHPVRVGWTLDAGVSKPAETSPAAYRFRITVAPKETATLEVVETHAGDTSYGIDSLNDDQVRVILTGVSDPNVEQALRAVMEKKAALAAVEWQIGEMGTRIEGIFRDQARVRENMRSLKGSAEERQLVQR